MSISEKAKLFGKEWQVLTKEQKDDFYTRACEQEQYDLKFGKQQTVQIIQPKEQCHVARPMEAMDYLEENDEQFNYEDEESVESSHGS